MPGFALLLAARVASINLCTDEYLLLLARPSEIASITYLAQDPLESVLWRSARGHPVNYGSVEQILDTRPDVLLTMGGGGRAGALLAGRMKMKAIELRSPTSFGDVAANLKTVARALGDSARAEPWIRRLQRIESTRPASAKSAIILFGSGQSLTPGSPGVRWLRHAGLAHRPLPGSQATLETLLTRPPAVIVESNYRRRQVSAATRWLDHPIVRNLKAQRVATDGRAWTCMGPLMIAETERLRKLVH